MATKTEIKEAMKKGQVWLVGSDSDKSERLVIGFDSDDMLVTSLRGNDLLAAWSEVDYESWTTEKPVTKVTLYRYTYKYTSGEVEQVGWTSLLRNHTNIVKTETREIEI